MKDWAIDFEQMDNPDDVCGYCRKLMKKEDPPETLYIYRKDMLCLTVDVPAAAKLKLHGTKYVKHRPQTGNKPR